MIYVINQKQTAPEGITTIDTTSRSNIWSRGLSPFFLGPVDLYGNYTSKNVENGWQFSKVYGHLNHLDFDLNPTKYYFEWAEKGWNDSFAHRYPMGHGIKPEFSYWDGQKLDYVTARKTIYIPLYAKAVKDTNAFKKLKELHANEEHIALVDFDAHGLTPGTYDYWDLVNNPNYKVGHAYVLAMMLENKLEF